jgi:two-component sensor histidine kinase
MQQQKDVSTVYLFDRIAVFGWAVFPVMLTMLFYYLSQTSNRFIRLAVFYFLVPLSLSTIIRYLYHAPSIKYFYKAGEIWYFSVNLISPWAYVFLAYLLICGAISFHLVYIWLISGNTNKERLQAKVVFFSLFVFFFISLLTNIVLPFWGMHTLPPMAHFNFIPLIIGVFFSLTNLGFRPFNRETLSQFMLKRVHSFILFIDSENRLLGANQFTLKKLGYSQSGLSDVTAGQLFEQGFDMQGNTFTGDTKANNTCVNLIALNGEKIPVSGSCISDGKSLQSAGFTMFVGSDYQEEAMLIKKIDAAQIKSERYSAQNARLKKLIHQRDQELQEAREQLNTGRYERSRESEPSVRDLKQKEQLIQEIHHRVKNNMQLVISLVNMLKYHKDVSVEVAGKLGGIADRIRKISAIHEDLYATPYLSRINFGQFLRKATGSLNSQLRPNRKVLVNLNVDGEYLPVDLALPCGLVFHELLHNALKHAFPDSGNDGGIAMSPALISIEFFQDEHRYTLMVSDNGIGIRESGVEPDNTEKIGLKLVKVLVQDHLKGELEIKRSFGTVAIVRFNNPGNLSAH